MDLTFRIATKLGQTFFQARRVLLVGMMLLLISAAAGVDQRVVVRGQQSPSDPLQRPSDPPLSAEAILALMREVDARHEAANVKLARYSYLLKRTERQLNDQGQGTKYRIQPAMSAKREQSWSSELISELRSLLRLGRPRAQ